MPVVYHVPVMPAQVAACLIKGPDGLFLDATLGGGGHTHYLLDRLGPAAKIIGMDRDGDAISHCQSRFKGENRLSLIQSRFSELGSHLKSKEFLGILFDLGVSSYQINTPSRGFRFENSNLLDMRMDQSIGQTAMQYLKSVNEISLAAVFSQHADLPRSLTLAKRIKAMLPEYEEGDLLQAATDSVFRVKGPKRNSILARVFQAIRMQLNSEIGEIEKALKSAVDLLQIQGRLCVLTYHSVEDRMVKQTLASYERKCICPPEQVICSCGGDNRRLKKVYKKPLLPERSEIAVNSRARSAKLRVVEKIK